MRFVWRRKYHTLSKVYFIVTCVSHCGRFMEWVCDILWKLTDESRVHPRYTHCSPVWYPVSYLFIQQFSEDIYHHRGEPIATPTNNPPSSWRILLQAKLIYRTIFTTNKKNNNQEPPRPRHFLSLLMIESILKFWLALVMVAEELVPRLWVKLCLLRSQFLRNTFPHAEQL